ncbi:ATP-binding protein [Amycolatopsis sp. CB00013]|uniref:ATP-binding protein n=1 Tax=Amycolatopsis sp. CB00013 TaxID=1703945 RepID=UPI00093B2007|nr:tetratricopeptide repeat protein [Amycolatopsis sp. CB00013]OKJ95655.1 hypothetical protein AMK34_21860 [Amycolatopsis sp. CB00013]
MQSTQELRHHTIVVLDVEGFGARARTNLHQRAIRDGLYKVARRAFDAAGVPWNGCYHEDRGDAIFVLAPAETDKSRFVERLPPLLVTELRVHNDTHVILERIRLRMALHAGEVHYDSHGVTSASLTLAFRLNAAPALKAALAASPGVLALVVSGWFFEDVVRHAPGAAPASYVPVEVEVKEVTTVGWVALPDHPHFPAVGSRAKHGKLTAVGKAPVVSTPASTHQLTGRPLPPGSASSPHVSPRQLPPAPAHFVGRNAELQAMTRTLDEAADRGGTVLISPLAGAGGIGKTWLALHWAHRVADRFPDGQLFVDLRGFSPEGSPMSSETAVRGFLDALGADPEKVPSDPHAQEALYRSLTAELRMLILLDNAATADQVIPLLPGGDSSLVIITSRRILTTLISRHGAHHLHLNPLPPEDARALLTDWLTPHRVNAEPEAVDDLIRYCHGFALALGIIAGRAHAHPHISLRQAVAELRELGLDALDDDDPAASLPAILSWSFLALTHEQQTLFVFLGAAPGPDISLAAAVAMANLPPLHVRRTLHSLEEASLLDRDSRGRYAMHDLIRSYATTMTCDHAAGHALQAALQRVVDFYLHAAFAADRKLRPHRRPIDLGRPLCGETLRIADYRAALEWCDSERMNLLAAIVCAVDHGWKKYAWQIPWTLTNFFRVRGHWQEWVRSHQVMIKHSIGEVSVDIQARLHHDLAWAFSHIGQWGEAISNCMTALELFKANGDEYGNALCLGLFGAIYTKRGEYEIALGYYRESLALDEKSGQILRAHALLGIGRIEGKAGRFQTAATNCRAAIEIYRDAGNANDQARALDALGEVLALSDRHGDAVDCYQDAVKLFADSGELFGQAEALHHLATVLILIGHRAHARDRWLEALEILETLRHPFRDTVRARLAETVE